MSFNEFTKVEVIEMLITLVEDKDIYTGGHSKRVAMYASKIGEKLNLTDEENQVLYHTGLLHDIGKVLTPDSILLKPARLKTAEFQIIKRHPVDSEKMVSSITSLKEYQKIIRHHHERYDGKGYPDGLKGEEIPLLSRILSVADSFDAMTSNRIYKHKKSIPEAIKEIRKCAGSQFDPNLIFASVEVFESSTKASELGQIPQTTIELERFAYFFKDALTGAYSPKYLDYFLQENYNNKQFKCCYFIQVHHMHLYNEIYGWEQGNHTLMEISLRIKALFHSSFVFRVFGDDFVVLNASHVEIDYDEIKYKLCASFKELSVTCKHVDLDREILKNWKSLERYIQKHFNN